MPKTKYLYNRQEKQNDAIAARSRQLAGEIGRICFMYKLTQKQLAESVGMADNAKNMGKYQNNGGTAIISQVRNTKISEKQKAKKVKK